MGTTVDSVGSWSYFPQHTYFCYVPSCNSISIPTPSFLPFFSFPWNPFHVIKDTQIKWPHWRSGFQQESRSALSIRPRAVLGWLAEGSATARINIISVINIKSALLCFAPGSVPKLWGPVRRSPWPFTKPIIYFGEFLRYCFVRANQGWVTNDPGGVVGRPSVSGTRGQTRFLKVSCQLLSSLTRGRVGVVEGGGGQMGAMLPSLPPFWNEVTTLTSVPGPKLDMTLSLIGALN